MTQNERLANYLKTGRPLTPSVARNKFGCRRLSARIGELRNEGYCIYTNRTEKGTSYRMGTPSRSIVAMAYKLGGSAHFTR